VFLRKLSTVLTAATGECTIPRLSCLIVEAISHSLSGDDLFSLSLFSSGETLKPRFAQQHGTPFLADVDAVRVLKLGMYPRHPR